MKIIITICIVLVTITLIITLIYFIRLLIKLTETANTVNIFLKEFLPELKKFVITVNTAAEIINVTKNLVTRFHSWLSNIATISLSFISGLNLVKNIFYKKEDKDNGGPK